MPLARRVGLGFASRGKVSDAVGWAERARAAGLESVWFHDSYFERDAVTYASAVASQVDEIGIGLGALNPFTRHPVLIAMTVSSLDEMAPSRIRLGLGSALPLRLGQMGIPYSPDEAATRTTATIDTLHRLWSGERIPAGKEGLPPIQPMFPPVHRVPIYIAGYRSPMMVVAGQKGDGYLARPAESIPGLRKLLRVMERAARDAGLEYTTRLCTVLDLRSGDAFAAQSLVYSVQNDWRRRISLLWNSGLFQMTRNRTLMRLSIHPPDYSFPAIWSQIERFITEMIPLRLPTTYRDWIAEQRRAR